jgi:hypothetical protein
MALSINTEAVAILDVSGQGGKEQTLLRAFPTLKRTAETDYDFVDGEGKFYEMKKQQDTQWFDLWKYADDEKNKTITLICVMHGGKTNSGHVTGIYTINLHRFVSLLKNNAKSASEGWNATAMGLAAQLRAVAPSVQTKAKVRMVSFVANNIEHFEKLY